MESYKIDTKKCWFSHIHNAWYFGLKCVKAIHDANERKHIVDFRYDKKTYTFKPNQYKPLAEMEWNGTEMRIYRQDTMETLDQRWTAECEASRIEWLNSPEGKASIAQQNADRAKRQAILDDGMAKLPMLNFKKMDNVVKWLTPVIEALCYQTTNNTDKERGVIFNTLLAKGFKINHHVIPKTLKEGAKRAALKAKLNNDPRTYAEYCIGQTLAFMSSNGLMSKKRKRNMKGTGPIHDVCWTWAEKYFAIKKKGKVA